MAADERVNVPPGDAFGTICCVVLFARVCSTLFPMVVFVASGFTDGAAV